MVRPVRLIVPVSLTVMFPGVVLVEPRGTLPKLMEVGETVKTAAAPVVTPVPVSETGEPVTVAPV